MSPTCSPICAPAPCLRPETRGAIIKGSTGSEGKSRLSHVAPALSRSPASLSRMPPMPVEKKRVGPVCGKTPLAPVPSSGNMTRKACRKAPHRLRSCQLGYLVNWHRNSRIKLSDAGPRLKVRATADQTHPHHPKNSPVLHPRPNVTPLPLLRSRRRLGRRPLRTPATIMRFPKPTLRHLLLRSYSLIRSMSATVRSADTPNASRADAALARISFQTSLPRIKIAASSRDLPDNASLELASM